MKARATVYGAAFAIGFGGLVAQVVVLREMVVTFYGNELSIGVMLAAWLLWTGLGSLGLGRLAARWREPRRRLAVALGLGACLLLATVVMARCLGPVLASGEAAGEIRPFRVMLVASLVVLAPLCLLNGLLFPLACRVASAAEGAEGRGVGRVYLAEAAGAAAGGACFSFLLVHWLRPLSIAFGLAALWWLAALFMAASRRERADRLLTGVALCAFALLAAGLAAGAPGELGRRLDRAYWEPLELASTADSRYGRVAVVGQRGNATQRSLYRNGTLAFSYPDLPEAESLVHLPMLQHPEPKRVLLLGGGLGGAVEEVLKHPSVEAVTVVELDPLVVRSVRREFPPGAGAVLDDPRVTLALTDGRRFLKETGQRFDVVIDAEGPPTTAQTNRFYTRECFAEIAGVLEPGGVLAFRAAGGRNYIPDENRRLLAGLHRTLAGALPHVVVFPGAQCTFLASSREGMPGYRLDVLAERMAERGLATSYVDPLRWEASLVGGRLEELEEALAGAHAAPVNRDLAPRCYYDEAQRWSAQQRARGEAAAVRWFELGRVLAWLDGRPWVAVVVVLGVVAAVSLPVPLIRGRSRDGVLSFAVASTGVVEMAVEFVVLLGFQVAYGYVYQYVGILMASFMVGLAAGAWVSTRWVARGGATWRRLIGVQALICLYPLILLGFLHLATGTPLAASALFAGVSFSVVALAAGLMGGLQFPVAAALHSGGGRAAGTLYGQDLFGACLGALAVSSVLVPTFGMGAVCLLLAGLGGVGLLGVALVSRAGRAKTV